MLHNPDNVLPAVDVHIRVAEIFSVQSRIVCRQKFGIIRYDRAVEVVIAVSLVDIVAHTRIENEINALIEKVFNMAVSKLGRIAHGIRGYRMLSKIVHITGAFIAYNRFKAKLRKESVPERKLLVKAERKGQTHSAYRTLRLLSGFKGKNAVVFIFIEIGNFVCFRLAAAFFAAVA